MDAATRPAAVDPRITQKSDLSELHAAVRSDVSTLKAMKKDATPQVAVTARDTFDTRASRAIETFANFAHERISTYESASEQVLAQGLAADVATAKIDGLFNEAFTDMGNAYRKPELGMGNYFGLPHTSP